jgi:hypothetical protein
MARMSALSRTPTTYASCTVEPICQPADGLTRSSRRPFDPAPNAKLAFGDAMVASDEPALSSHVDDAASDTEYASSTATSTLLSTACAAE